MQVKFTNKEVNNSLSSDRVSHPWGGGRHRSHRTVWGTGSTGSRRWSPWPWAASRLTLCAGSLWWFPSVAASLPNLAREDGRIFGCLECARGRGRRACRNEGGQRSSPASRGSARSLLRILCLPSHPQRALPLHSARWDYLLLASLRVEVLLTHGLGLSLCLNFKP